MNTNISQRSLRYQRLPRLNQPGRLQQGSPEDGRVEEARGQARLPEVVDWDASHITAVMRVERWASCTIVRDDDMAILINKLPNFCLNLHALSRGVPE